MPVSVLLVDDVDEVRRLVRTALRFRGGFDVVGEAGSGNQAVELAEKLQPDLVVLDIGLPDLAGREVLSRIRLHSAVSKVVVFSGGEIPDHAWIADRVEGYVLKDEDVDYLVDLLESVGRQRPVLAELDLPQVPGSVRAARRFVAEKIAEWGMEALLDDALLVTSELATNAITHAASDCCIRLSATGSALRIHVVDTGSGTPEPQPESATEEHGRGLRLVDALTSAWGLEVLPGQGKVVWAELSRPA